MDVRWVAQASGKLPQPATTCVASLLIMPLRLVSKLSPMLDSLPATLLCTCGSAVQAPTDTPCVSHSPAPHRSCGA